MTRALCCAEQLNRTERVLDPEDHQKEINGLNTIFFSAQSSLCLFLSIFSKVDLGGLKKVTGFATQGNMDWLRDSWVTNLEVMSSRDSVNWYKEFNGKVNNTATYYLACFPVTMCKNFNV